MSCSVYYTEKDTDLPIYENTQETTNFAVRRPTNQTDPDRNQNAVREKKAGRRLPFVNLSLFVILLLVVTVAIGIGTWHQGLLKAKINSLNLTVNENMAHLYERLTKLTFNDQQENLASCKAVQDFRQLQGLPLANGVYQIVLSSRRVEVWCDFTSGDGGWTVFQKRGQYGNPEDFFDKNLKEYVQGFGDPSMEYWLGLKNIKELIDQSTSTILRIDLTGHDGVPLYAEYTYFKLSGPFYNLTLGTYSGDAGDSFTQTELSAEKNVDVGFSTPDHDVDLSTSHCAQLWQSGWWFGSCFYANLNGLNKNTNENDDWNGIIWNHNKSISLPEVQMKLRSA